jgi:hypothetical protein
LCGKLPERHAPTTRVLSAIDGTQSNPRGKFEARNPKLETIPNEQEQNSKKFQTNRFGLRFGICHFVSFVFEIVSDFDIQISNLGINLSFSRTTDAPICASCNLT